MNVDNLDIGMFDSEVLIFEVQKRPALYDKSLPEYADRSVKMKLWSEVSRAMRPNWVKMSAAEKNKQRKEIQMKWRHIRDNFRKEINIQKRRASGAGSRKRRKYIYFDQLRFLMPALCNEDINHDEETILLERSSDAHEAAKPELVTDENTERANKRIDGTKPKKKSYEELLLELIKQKESSIDEDRLFALSLVPSLRQLKPEKKLMAKAEILNVIRNITFPSAT